MTVEKKTIRSDIPGHHNYLGTAAHPGDDTRRLTVGRGITLNGELGDCEHLAVEGTVSAPAFCARRLDVAESGTFSGRATVQQAVILGRFEGSLCVKGRLTIKATAVITGEIEYGTLEAEAGCRIEGRLMALAAPVIEAPAVLTAPKAPAKAPRGPNNVERLFADDPDEDRMQVYRRAKAN